MRRPGLVGGLMAGGSKALSRAALAALQLLPMSALQRIADSSRTLRHAHAPRPSRRTWRHTAMQSVGRFRTSARGRANQNAPHP
jgi:hypothetical protein